MGRSNNFLIILKTEHECCLRDNWKKNYSMYYIKIVQQFMCNTQYTCFLLLTICFVIFENKELGSF